MNLIFLGAPGSGKGTQAVRLAEKISALHLSTGDLLRAAVKNGTELGKKAEGYMKAGELVPDDIIIGLIEEQQNNGKLKNGFILDGFPRTIPQAEALSEMFERSGAKIDYAVLLDVDDEEIIKRLSGRMYCGDCQSGYNYPANMPKEEGVCDQCGGKLVRRPDDEPEVVKNRLDVYKKQTQPIEDYYKGQSLLLPIPGIGTPNEIFDRIVKGLGV
ncbi:MAG: adenylate kinase [candidate division Zixibacteria bacterium]